VNTEILPSDSPELFELAVHRAVELLRAGQVVALPTETVYGLCANALDPLAVSNIFKIKGRPANNPIIAHVATLEMAKRCVSDWPTLADAAARAFWPGPLTLVLPRSEAIPDVLTAGGSTVGIRWPSHPLMQAVIQRCGFPLAAPSANLSNQLSPTNATHVAKQLGGKIPLIVDGGQAQVGIESTVLDLSVCPSRVLRPGVIHNGALAAVLGELASSPEAGEAVLKSPGMLEKHYAPRARVAIVSWQSEHELNVQTKRLGTPPGKIHIIAHTRVPSGQDYGSVNVIPHDAEAFARAIYAQLHQCDDAGAEWIIIESVPDAQEWSAISDRLHRAAHSV